VSQTKQSQDVAASPAYVRAVDRGVEIAVRTVNVLGQWAGGVFDMIGVFLARLLDGLGNALNRIPAAGKILRGMFHWLGTILSAGFDLLSILISSLVNLLTNGLGGIVRILTGLLGSASARDGGLVRKGLADVLAGFTGAVIAIFAKTAAFVHAVVFMQMGERPLNEHEKAIIRKVYRNSIATQNIRVIEGFVGSFSTNNRPFALGNRIYMKHHDSATDPGLFAHECCHIWQYQREGVRYLIEALWAQWTVKKPYRWEAEIERGNVRWQDFNREAQAQFVQNLYTGGHRTPSTNTAGEFYDDDPIGEAVEFNRNGVDYTDLARDTITFIRNKGISG